MPVNSKIRVGCAGWSLRKEHKEHFPQGASHLERYAKRFTAVEINSSFRQDHMPSTYARWAQAVPETFKFSVKMPRKITHETRLADPSLLEDFLNRVTQLGHKLGPLLIQLPPGLEYDASTVTNFFSILRNLYDGTLVCEPRHVSWFDTPVEDTLKKFEIARVATDPLPAPGADLPGGWEGLIYYRLHGSPDMYYSSYAEHFLDDLAKRLKEAIKEVPTWCIFDNTATGAATENALQISRSLQIFHLQS